MAQAVAIQLPKVTSQPRVRSPWAQIVARIAKNKLALVGVAVILGMVLTAIFANVVAPYPYDAQNLDAITQAPSAAHWLGTDSLGRDMLSRLIYGARSAVFVVVLVTLVDLALGIPLGAISGYFGGWIDTIMMRVVEILFAFPGLLFVFLIAATAKPAILEWARSHGLTDLAKTGYLDYAVVIIALGFVGWGGLARFVRDQVMAFKVRDFVLSAHAVGVPTWQVIQRHILPNALAPIIVLISTGMGFIALSEGYLSFFGIGLQPPNASWGNMMAENAGRYWRTFPQSIWLVWIPGFILTSIILAFAFLGDALNEALNPELVD